MPAKRILLEINFPARGFIWVTLPYFPCLSEHRVGVIGGGRHGLQYIPVLDDLAIGVEAKYVDTSGFPASPIQVTHMYKGEVAINGDAFHLAPNAAGLLDVAHDAVEAIRKQGIVLDVWPGHESRKQINSALVEDLVENDVNCVSDVISCRSAFRFHNP
jgi:hypothetical protein